MCSCLCPVHPRLGCCLPAGLWKIIPPSPGQLESALFAEASDGSVGQPVDPSVFSKGHGWEFTPKWFCCGEAGQAN